MRRVVHLLVLSAMVLLPHAATGGQDEEELKDMPGYVDFDALTGFGAAESTVEIYIQDPILSLVANLTRGEDPELSELLSGLKLIRVQTYPLVAAAQSWIDTYIDRTRKGLEEEGWQIVVRAREPDEQVHVYIKSSKDRIDGLAIVAAEYGEEISFVNIVGDIDLNVISKLGDKFDIPGLDSLEELLDTPSHSASMEYRVKAAILATFPRHIEWPEDVLPDTLDTFTIGIIGQSGISDVWDQLEERYKHVNGRKIQLRRFAELEDLTFCHELFISRSKENRLAEILEHVEGWPTLTVSDVEGFAQRGGMINLIVSEGRTQYIITSKFESAGLKVSTKLLMLAETRQQ